MPTYEYECKSCNYTFEAFQSMKDPPLENCPQCGKNVRRLINGGTGIIFKGSGFYVTDKSKGSKSGTVKPSQAESSPADSSKSTQSPAASSSTESSGAEKSRTGSEAAPASAAPQTAKT
jgi:putative FmdB family regulatory protein